MDTGGIESAGRVTRALRKRLTSVDSDNGSSRPGTPVVQSKLATTTANSPLKPRMTRRNSTPGTPVKTPGKRAVNDVPSRSTRQRNVSLSENEATPKHEKKTSHFEALVEEEETGTMTRSKSKSPEALNLKVKTNVAQQGRKSMLQNQSPNSEQSLHRKETDNDKDKSHAKNETSLLDTPMDDAKSTELEDFNNKENNIDILNAARQKLHYVYSNAISTKDNPKVMLKNINFQPYHIDGQKIESPKKRISLSNSFVAETREVNLAETLNVPTVSNYITAEKVKPFERYEVQTNVAFESLDYDGMDEVYEEDIAGYVIRKDDYIRQLKESKLMKGVEKVMSECQVDDNNKSTQIDVAPNVEIGFDTLANDEEINEDIQRASTDNNENFENISLGDNEDVETYAEIIHINAEKLVCKKPDESSKSMQSDITPRKEIGSKSLTLNEEHEDIKKASPDKNKDSGNFSLRDNADEPDRETIDVNAENAMSPNPDGCYQAVSTTPSPFNAETHSLHHVQTTTPAKSVKSDITSGRVTPKIVAFASNNLDDQSVKNVYPKTPASAKNKSLAINNDESFKADYSINKSMISVHDTTDVEIAETQQTEITSTQSATTTIAKDDAVVSMAEDNTVNAEDNLQSNVQENEEGNNDELGEETDAESEIQLKWYSPRVTAKSSKLDTIGNGEKTEAVDDNYAHVEKKKPEETFISIICSDGEENEELLDEMEEERHEKKFKHVFIEEAMEIDDYESGDSMESEERRQINDNEIPVDGESIGSHTSDEEETEDAEYDNDSFVVSDESSAEENVTDSSYSGCDKEVKKSGDLKKTRKYTRFQRVLDTSTDEDDEASKINVSKRNELSPTKGSEVEDKVRKSENRNESKTLSMQLQYVSEDETKNFIEKETHNTSQGNFSTVMNFSQTEILRTNARNSHNSNRFSDMALQLQQGYIKDCEDLSVGCNINIYRKEIMQHFNQLERLNKSLRDFNSDVAVSPDAVPTINTKNSDSEIEKPTSTSGVFCEAYLHDKKSVNKEVLVKTKNSECHLAEISATSKGKKDQENACTGVDRGEEVEYVQDQENANAALSVSFKNGKQQKENKPLQKECLQQSFTIGVTVNDGELETAVTENKLTVSAPITISSSSPSASLSSNDDSDGNVLSSDDARYLENIKHMPLGNPLVRTRRQSLALPTNPDMEIGPIQHGGTKLHKRKSVAALLHNDFNPSQSFVDTMQLRKSQLERLTSKRKRLSKSLGGATSDVSTVDIDVGHLHKRSKLSPENSSAESSSNTKPDNSICLKVKHSSTPHEKGSTKQLNNSGVRRILNRCDEILEAANRAKLEAKLNYRKSKIRLPSKKKNMLRKRDNSVAPLSKEIKKCVKTAVTKALKASASLILNRKRKIAFMPSTNLSPVILESLVDNQSMTTNNKKGQLKDENVKYNYLKAEDNVVEKPPQKKKKAEIIRLPTGNVYVEPLSPKRRSINSCSGMIFNEIPVSPDAFGFTVFGAESGGGKPLFSTQKWTTSGIFMEEEVKSSQARKWAQKNRAQRQANNNNFKESAMNRADVKRSTNRELLQLRERQQFRNKY